MKPFHLLKMVVKSFDDQFRPHRCSILLALSLPDDNAQIFKVDVLYTETYGVADSKTRTIKQAGYELGCASHPHEHFVDFGWAKDDRKPARLLCPSERSKVAQIDVEHLAVKKDNRVERLILRRG